MATAKRVTIKDISKRIHVSPTTVANALNGYPNVSEELRERIIKEAEALGYKPNINAKAMVRNGISIALVCTEEPREYISFLIDGMHEQMELFFDYKVSLTEYRFHDNRSDSEAQDCVMRMIKERYDGIVFSASFNGESYFDALKDYVHKYSIPLLNLSNEIDGSGDYLSVKTDSAIIGAMVAQLIFLTSGSVKVGVISTTTKYSYHNAIVEVFKRECRRYGIEIADILYNDDSKSETYVCTSKLVTDHPDISVIYVTSYDSVQVCKCLQNKGLNDIKVISHDVYDGMIEYMKNGPLLATVYQNPKEVGRQSIIQLFNAIMGDAHVKKEVVVHPELVLSSNIDAYIKEL